LVFIGIVLTGTPRAVARDVGGQQTVAARDATESQSGRIQIFDRGLLEITPYNSHSNLTRFWLNADSPVFYGRQQLTGRDLRSGTDVRVDFRRRPDGTAQATAVFVLTPLEAASSQLEAQDAPPEMAVFPDGINVPPLAPMTSNDQLAKQSHLGRATGSEAGTVTMSRGGRLVIQSLDSAPTSTTFELNAEVPVYNGSTVLGAAALEPGHDVRVYYDEGSGGTAPRVVAVEILSPEERRMEEGG
jgi:hypothetical protein